MPLLYRLAPLAACWFAAAPLAAQTVHGKVLDAATGEGVSEAAVKAVDAEGHDQGHARTAADGSFRLQLRVPQGVRIQAQRAGYRPTLTAELPVAAHEAVEVEVRLSAAALAIEPLRVTARVEPPRRRSLELNGFYARERMGIGRYVRREDFENRGNTDLAHVLSRVQGAAIHYQGVKQYIYFTRNGKPRLNQSIRGSDSACLPRLFLDGTKVTYDAQNDINAVVSPNQIEAIEVFRGASEIPAQYNDSNSMCGVILIWTRQEN
jgi:hypothetical protein